MNKYPYPWQEQKECKMIFHYHGNGENIKNMLKQNKDWENSWKSDVEMFLIKFFILTFGTTIVFMLNMGILKSEEDL